MPRVPDDLGGLPWPESYQELLPLIHAQWDVEGEIYLVRQLSGKSGALVYAADLTVRGFSGQAILKLDQAPDSEWQEENEAERHRRAFEVNPDYASRHLPRLLHTLHHGKKLAILSTIAGGGLEYALPWHRCPYDQQLAVTRLLSAGLLEGWNPDHQLAKGVLSPQSLLTSWLDYRLDPARKPHSRIPE